MHGTEIPLRSMRTYLDFGSMFAEDDILVNIPYSHYAELVFKASQLKAKGILEKEKSGYWLDLRHMNHPLVGNAEIT